MKVEILKTSPQYPVQFREINGVQVWCIGTLHDYKNDPCTALYEIFTEDGCVRQKEVLRTSLLNLQGNFACIIRDIKGHLFAAVDKIRSYTFFYTVQDGTFLGSTDPYTIKARLPHLTKNGVTFLEFKMAGYVTGGNTLFNEIRQLQAGEYLLQDEKDLLVENYYIFYNPVSFKKSREDLIQELHEITRHVFQKLIERLDGRPAWVPLSGGLDSRLVLCMLKQLGHDNIQTFSYGIPGNCEAAAAKVIAQKMGVPWFFIPYTRSLGRRIFQSKEREAYFHFAHELSGIPMMTDFYALHELSAQKRIPKDAVLINGQTGDFISGEHIPVALDQDHVSYDVLLDAIIKKHYSLWTQLKTPEHIDIVKELISRVLKKRMSAHMTREGAMKVYELWEWRGRQAQHVVAGQRAYDFFGIAWELPLWDDEYLHFWSQIPFTRKYKQALYRQYLEQYDFFGVFRMKFKRYTPPRWAHFLENAFVVFGPKREEYRKMMLQYWQKYSFFYAKDSYRTYLSYARFHRNPSSVLVKDMLWNEYKEPLL
ncbi:hypothetical protein HY477_03405 [Candidatus Uhrbacteria bacterium]|nr:hypothetical protein [Candidatus Uhrbacteria bacterium]